MAAAAGQIYSPFLPGFPGFPAVVTAPPGGAQIYNPTAFLPGAVSPFPPAGYPILSQPGYSPMSYPLPQVVLFYF